MDLCKKCKYKEVGKGKYGVKGFTLVKECDECKAKREANNIKESENLVKEKKILEAEELIQAKIRELAISELVKENKIIKTDDKYEIVK
jgi:hypothetical protein